MAKKHFSVRRDGEGRVRYFIEHSECPRDHYIQVYVKEFGLMPVDPPLVPEGAVVTEKEIDSAPAVEHLVDGQPVSAEEFNEELKAVAERVGGEVREEPNDDQQADNNAPSMGDLQRIADAGGPEQSAGDEPV